MFAPIEPGCRAETGVSEKSGVQSLMRESKASVRRYLEEVPLTPDAQAIAENDLEKIDTYIRKVTGPLS